MALIAKLLACNIVVTARAIAFGFSSGRSGRDGFSALLPAKVCETDDNSDPVEVIGDDGAICRAVLPAKKRVEDTPTALAVIER